MIADFLAYLTPRPPLPVARSSLGEGERLSLVFDVAHAALVGIGRAFGRHIGIPLQLVQHLTRECMLLKDPPHPGHDDGHAVSMPALLPPLIEPPEALLEKPDVTLLENQEVLDLPPLGRDAFCCVGAGFFSEGLCGKVPLRG